MPIQQNLPHAPATARNREPIRSVLDSHLKKAHHVLEIASGTGEHIAWLAPQYPNTIWQPSDVNPDVLPIIDAYNQKHALVRQAVRLDTQASEWPVTEKVDLIMCVNMTHISSFESTVGLLNHGITHIKPNGILLVYGPFNQNNQFTSAGNEAFHHSLRGQNPKWGLRDIEAVIQIAEEAGWYLIQIVDMPANNKSILFQATQ